MPELSAGLLGGRVGRFSGWRGALWLVFVALHQSRVWGDVGCAPPVALTHARWREGTEDLRGRSFILRGKTQPNPFSCHACSLSAAFSLLWRNLETTGARTCAPFVTFLPCCRARVGREQLFPKVIPTVMIFFVKVIQNVTKKL